MGENLRWKPEDQGKILHDDLKCILRNYFPLNGGSITFGYSNTNCDDEQHGFLKGLVAAQIKGAQELCDAIKKHGTVIVWIE